ncbi:hypothetical protein [Streptomyces sp. NPDC002520]
MTKPFTFSSSSVARRNATVSGARVTVVPTAWRRGCWSWPGVQGASDARGAYGG